MKAFFPILIFFSLLTANAQPYYTRNVVRRGDEVYLRGFRPQLQKGKTCAFYSTSMILDYYGQYVSAQKLRKTNQLTQQTPPKKTSKFISQKLESLGFTYIYTNEKSCDFFCKTIKFSIDHGIPVRWECDLKFSPIPKERKGKLTMHARIIMGYVGRTQITHIIYADSWGENALHKIMDIEHAHKMTRKYGPVFPKKDSKEILEGFKNL